MIIANGTRILDRCREEVCPQFHTCCFEVGKTISANASRPKKSKRSMIRGNHGILLYQVDSRMYVWRFSTLHRSGLYLVGFYGKIFSCFSCLIPEAWRSCQPVHHCNQAVVTAWWSESSIFWFFAMTSTYSWVFHLSITISSSSSIEPSQAMPARSLVCLLLDTWKRTCLLQDKIIRAMVLVPVSKSCWDCQKAVQVVLETF